MTRWPALAPYTVVSSRYIESVFKSPRNLRRWDGGGAGTMKSLRDRVSNGILLRMSFAK